MPDTAILHRPASSHAREPRGGGCAGRSTPDPVVGLGGGYLSRCDTSVFGLIGRN